ncbi:MAG: hypothetical protein PHE55_18155 [Methylococcaceae bacterium]|nr:hypothetical protein [Methylococcaceae bacterium]
MNHSISKRTSFSGFFLAAFSVAGMAASGDCWLDVYDKTEFNGNHAHLEGPAQLANLGKLNNEDWGSRIESLIVGPKARVLAFRKENFKEDETGLNYHGDAIQRWGEKPQDYSNQEISFGPGRKEHHLGELNFHRSINSLTIKCMP